MKNKTPQIFITLKSGQTNNEVDCMLFVNGTHNATSCVRKYVTERVGKENKTEKYPSNKKNITTKSVLVVAKQ